MKNINLSRRRLLTGLGAMGLATAFYEIPGVFAEALVTTPEQTEGPYYPPNLPLDTDNDLLVVNNNITPAVGTILYLSGTVFDSSGNPVRDAHLEIWHADNTGAYIHHSSREHGVFNSRPKLSRIRPISDGIGRSVFVSHHQAGTLHRPHTPHPYEGEAARTRGSHDSGLFRRGTAERHRHGAPRYSGCSAAGIRDYPVVLNHRFFGRCAWRHFRCRPRFNRQLRSIALGPEYELGREQLHVQGRRQLAIELERCSRRFTRVSSSLAQWSGCRRLGSLWQFDR